MLFKRKQKSISKGTHYSVISLLVYSFIVTGGSSAAIDSSASLEQLLPAPGSIAGLELGEEPKTYNRSTLYEYINGGAELYLSYGFERLISAFYLLDGDEEKSLVLDIYDMATPLQAFGVFGANRREEAGRVPLGTEGLVSDYLLTFYHDRYYVELNAGGLDKKLLEARLAAAGAVDKKIEGPAVPPSELGLLPADNLIPGSTRYITGGLLGHGFLPRGIEADYQMGESRVKASLALFPNEAEAISAFDILIKHYRDRGEEPKRIKKAGSEILAVNDPYRETVIITVKDRRVVIISDLPTPDAGLELMAAVLAKAG